MRKEQSHLHIKVLENMKINGIISRKAEWQRKRKISFIMQELTSGGM